MEPRSLKYIAGAIAGELRHGPPETMVTRVCTDSRQVAAGDLFFALAGGRFDGHAFLPEAARRGAAAVVAERREIAAGFAGMPVIAVDDTRAALGRLGARYRREFDPAGDGGGRFQRQDHDQGVDCLGLAAENSRRSGAKPVSTMRLACH